MAKTIKVRVPAMVTADGKWAINGSNSLDGDPDWPWLDEMCDHEKPTICPTRMFITVELPLPEIGEVEATEVSVEK